MSALDVQIEKIKIKSDGGSSSYYDLPLPDDIVKFITENKLEDLDTWNSFLQDLDGENEDSAKVDFEDDSAVENQLLNWMDFWSKGNNDDRTLAIIY